MLSLTNLTFTKFQIWSTFTVTNTWALKNIPFPMASPTWYVFLEQP